MYNTQINTMPAYTNREFVNFGLHRANELYSYKFTMNDRALLQTGAISLFPKQICEYKVSHDAILNGSKKKANDILDYKDFQENVLETLLKTGIVICDLKPEYKNLSSEDLIKNAKLYDTIGLSVKEVSNKLNIDIADIRNSLGLKSNATKRQIKEEDLEKIKELIK